MRGRYLYEYRRIYAKNDRIRFFEEISEMAAAESVLGWKIFADAMSAWLRKDLGAALALSEDAIAIDPTCAYPWNGKGNVLQSQKRHEEALAAYEQAIALDPDFASAHLNRANVATTAKEFFDHLKHAVATAGKASEGERLLILAADAGSSGNAAKQKSYGKGFQHLADPPCGHQPSPCSGDVPPLQSRHHRLGGGLTDADGAPGGG